MLRLHHSSYREIALLFCGALIFFAAGVAVTYIVMEQRLQAVTYESKQTQYTRTQKPAFGMHGTGMHVQKPTDSSQATVPPTVPDVRIPPVENGLAPVVTNLPTKEPVVFLGIDDGAHKTPDELQTMKDNHIKASLFLSRLFINENPDFFKDFVEAGNLIEDHTLDHVTTMSYGMTYEQQKEQICGMADYEQKHYGRRPILFRPPGGAYSTTMRRAAADCGMKAVVTWIAKANGGAMQYQVGDHLRPGDVVLMHFRPEFQADMAAFIAAMKQQHLHTELIENWLPVQ